MTAHLLPLCQAAVDAARLAGADEAEAYAQFSRGVTARAEQNDLSGAESSESLTLGLRVLVRGAVGFATINRVEDSVLAEAARTAVALARAGVPEEGPTLMAGESVTLVADMLDPSVGDTGVEEAVERCAALLKAARGVDPRVSIDGADVSFSVDTHAVVNSRGVRALETQSSAGASVFGMAVDGDDVTGFDQEMDAQVRKDALVGPSLGAILGQRLLTFLGARAWDGPSSPCVVLAPDVLQELLLAPLLASVDGEGVRTGKSRWRDARGAPVAHPMLTLTDDPLTPGEVSSESFDREGRPHRALHLVRDGVLQGFLHHTDSARRLGDAPTGHAAGGARGVPYMGPTRILVAPGGATLEDLLREAGDGLYVGRFSGAVDEVSGDFSGVAKCSFRIRNGALAEPLRETMLAGNAFDALKALRGLTVQRKRLPGLLLPHALLAGVDVSSGA